VAIASGNMTAQTSQKVNSYLKNQIYSMAPLQLLIKVYDYAIIGCKARDMEKASKALVELIAALRFEYEEISLGLFRLYQFCMDEIKKENYEVPLKILGDLRSTWVEVAKRSSMEKIENGRLE